MKIKFSLYGNYINRVGTNLANQLFMRSLISQIVLYCFRHNIKDDVRQSLYDAAKDWMNVIHKKGTPFLGGKQPNLADISVYGILSSIEGCQAFQDLRENTDIGKWFDNMSSMVKTRGKITKGFRD